MKSYKITEIKKYKSYVWPGIVILTLIALAITYSNVWATNNSIQNGSFNSDLSTWSLSSQDGYSAPQALWQNSGFSGTINNGGNTNTAIGGAVQLYSNKGNGLERKGYLAQTLTVDKVPASNSVKLSFAWKKTWSSKKAGKQDMRVYIRVPSGAVYELWNHTSVSNTSDNNWYKVENLDITNRFTATGTYEIRLHTWLKTGSDNNSEADAWYDEVYLTGLGSAPVTPTGLTVSNVGDGSSLDLSWNATTGADGYNLERSADGGANYVKINSQLITSTSYRDTGLIKGTTYYYRISAVNSYGESAKSDPATGTPSQASEGPPATPTGLTVANNGDGSSLNVSWDPNSEANLAGYNLYRSQNGNDYTKINGSLINQNTFNDTGLTTGTTFYYKVSALNTNSEESALSAPEIGVPTVVVQASGWNLVRNQSFQDSLGYWYGGFYQETGLDWAEVQPVYNSGGYFGDVKNAGTTHKGQGGAAMIELTGASKKARAGLYQSKINVVPTGESVKLSFVWRKTWSNQQAKQQIIWVEIVKPDGRRAQVWTHNTVANMSGYSLVENLDVTEYFTQSGTYEIRLIAFQETQSHASSISRVFFDEVHLNVPRAPEVPAGLQVAVANAGGALDLSWEASRETGVSGYNIYRSISPYGSYNKINSNLVVETSYLNSGLNNGQHYYYRITAVNSNGKESVKSRHVRGVPIYIDPIRHPHHSYQRNTDACVLCHSSHRSLASMLIKESTQTAVCLTCHDGIGSKYNTQVHLDGTNTAYHPVNGSGIAPLGSMECSHCHNAHAGNGTRNTPRTAVGSLEKVPGVEVSYNSTSFTQPSAYIKKSAVEKEYELCFACHSSYSARPVETTTTQTAKEFNPSNRSAHNNIAESKTNGFGKYVNGWTANSPMYCSDCHGRETPDNHQGPHGSQYSGLLKRPFDKTSSAANSDNACFECHDRISYGGGGISEGQTRFGYNTKNDGTDWVNYHNVGNQGQKHKVACAQCHSAIPHGIGRLPALLVTTSDPTPYQAYSNNTNTDIFYSADGNWKSKKTCGTAGTGCH